VQNEPASADEVRRNSQGTRVRQNGGANWFHFAIPSPTMLDNKGVNLHSVALEASANANATIVSVHTYEGTTAVKRMDDLRWTNREDIDEHWNIPDKKIRSPIALSIQVEFDPGGEVAFRSARGTFYRIVGNID